MDKTNATPIEVPPGYELVPVGTLLTKKHLVHVGKWIPFTSTSGRYRVTAVEDNKLCPYGFYARPIKPEDIPA